MRSQSEIDTVTNTGSFCDSTISVCPATFDYLIKQDILEQKNKADLEICESENNILSLTIIEKDGIVSDKNIIIQSDSTLASINKVKHNVVKEELSTANKTITRKTIWQWIEGVLGFAGIAIVALK